MGTVLDVTSPEAVTDRAGTLDPSNVLDTRRTGRPVIEESESRLGVWVGDLGEGGVPNSLLDLASTSWVVIFHETQGDSFLLGDNTFQLLTVASQAQVRAVR